MILTTVNILSAIIVIITILLQQRGSGLSSTFGGSGQFYRTRRGIEVLLFRSTIIASILFFISAILLVILPRS